MMKSEYDHTFAAAFTVTEDLASVYHDQRIDNFYDFMDKSGGHDQFFSLLNDANLDFLDSAYLVTNQMYGKIEESIAKKAQYFRAFLDESLPLRNTGNEYTPVSPSQSSCKNYYGKSDGKSNFNDIKQRRECPMILPEGADPHTVQGTPQEQWIVDIAVQFAITIKTKNNEFTGWVKILINDKNKGHEQS